VVNVGEFNDYSYRSAGPIFPHRLTVVNQLLRWRLRSVLAT
jgi:hypothetical protein